MGGKKEKDANRTKGNTKPSSSARSAQLLAATGGGKTGFIGFGGFGGGGGGAAGHSGVAPASDPAMSPESEAAPSSSAQKLLSPSSSTSSMLLLDTAFVPLSGLDDSESGLEIPPEVRLTLRKMSKKDVVTKLKALHEFIDLLSSSSAAEVPSESESNPDQGVGSNNNVVACQVLPFWPRIYSKVAQDHDRRVREAAQKAMMEVVRQVGRTLARHLKSLMPLWYLSQFDPHAPTASAASEAMALAFPKEKKATEAVVFCQEEILALIEDNIVCQTKETLSDPKTSSPEDMENKFNRVVSSSLLAYARFLDQTRESLDKRSSAEEIHKRILSHANFWKAANHKVIMIQSSWFRCAAALASFTPDALFLEDPDVRLAEKLTAAVFSRLDAADQPQVMIAAWDAALVIAGRCKKWHELAGLDKVVIPKLHKLLSRGGGGGGNNAATAAHEIYPKLLPLLGQFPPEALSASVDSILASINKGLSSNQSQVAVPTASFGGGGRGRLRDGQRQGIRAMFEVCMLALTRMGDDCQAEEEQEKVLNHVLASVDSALRLQPPHTESGTIFENFSQLLQSLVSKEEKNNSKSSSSSSSSFSTLWHRLREMTLGLFDTYAEDEEGLANIAQMLSAIDSSCTSGKSSTNSGRAIGKGKKKGIRFHDDGEEEEGGVADVKVDDESVPLRTTYLYPLAAEMSATVMEEKGLGVSLAQTRFLRALFEKMGNDQFFQQIVQTLNLSAKKDGEDSSTSAAGVLLILLSSRTVSDSGNSLSTCSLLVDEMASLAVLLSSSMASVAERTAFYERSLASKDDHWTSAFLRRLCARKAEDDSVKAFLASDVLGKRLVEVAKRLGREKDKGSAALEDEEDGWKLLRIAFQHGDFISEENLNLILASFTSSVRSLSASMEEERRRKKKKKRNEEEERGGDDLGQMRKRISVALTLFCDLVLTLQSCNRLFWEARESRAVVLALLALDCGISSATTTSTSTSEAVDDKDCLTPECLDRIRTCWSSGLESLISIANEDEDGDDPDPLQAQAAEIVKKRLLSSSSDLAHLVPVAVKLANIVYSVSDDEGRDQRQQTLLLQMLPSPPEWTELRAATKSAEERLLALDAAATSSSSSLALLSDRVISNVAVAAEEAVGVDSCPRHVMVASFAARVLHSLFRHDDDEEEMGVVDSRQDEEGNYLEVFERPARSAGGTKSNRDGSTAEGEEEEEILDVANVGLLLDLMVELLNFASIVRHTAKKEGTSRESDDGDAEYLLDLTAWCAGSARTKRRRKRRLSLPCRKTLLSKLLERSLAEGFWWARTLEDFLLLAKADEKLSVSDATLPGGDDKEWTEGRVQTAQVLLPFVSRDALLSTLHMEVARLLSLSDLTAEAAGGGGGFVGGPSALLPQRLLPCLSLIAACLRSLESRKSSSSSSIVVGEEEKEAIKTILMAISRMRQASEELFLYGCVLTSSSDWLKVLLVKSLCEVMDRILVLRDVRIVIEPAHWDMMLCSVSSWMQTFEESHHCMEDKKQGEHALKFMFVLFSQASINLSGRLAEIISSAKEATDDDINSSNVPANILEEWTEFFSDGIFSVLLCAFVRTANDNNDNDDDNDDDDGRLRASLLASIGRTLIHVPDEQLFKHRLEPKFLVDDVDCDSNYSDHLVFLLNHLSPCVTSQDRAVQMTAFHLLLRVMDHLILEEESKEEKRTPSYSNSSDDHDDRRELPRRLCDLLRKTQPVVSSLFAAFDFEFAELVPLPPNNAGYTYTVAYLLVWRLLLRFVSGAKAELRPRFSEFMRQEGLMDVLMPVLFHLMPRPKLAGGGAGMMLGREPGLLPHLRGKEEDEEVQQLACSVFHGLLRQLPAMVRQWWNNAERRVADIVEKFTSSCATPILWSEEVETISGSKTTFDNMTIKVRSSVREVVATYTVDDGSMELVIQLPPNFPLGSVKVESGRRVGVGTAQWRNWMLQLNTFLQHQNGSILEGLSIWKRNVDKRFEGVEECYICFYILHGTNHQLPRLACRTCRKKFHSACLYKWFSTSMNSTCPLCRNLF